MARLKKDEAPAKGLGKLARAIAAAQAQLKGTSDAVVPLDEEILRASKPHLPTGSVVIDYLIGGRPNKFGVAPCPGLPKGQITQLYGWQSSGKTTLALTTAATTCARGGVVVYVDFEHEIAPDYAASLGVPISDPDRFVLLQPTTLEEGIRYIWEAAKEGADLIVIDSVGAGVPQATLSSGDPNDSGRLGLVASIWGQVLPKFKSLIARTETSILGIAQLRAAVNTMGYGEAKTIQGGNAWKFYSALRIELKVVKSEKGKVYNALKHKKEDQIVAATVKAKLEKCKVSSNQRHEAEFYLQWGTGIDDFKSLVEIASAHKVVAKSGNWYVWARPDGAEIKSNGVENFRTDVFGLPDGWDLLYQQTMAKLELVNQQIAAEYAEMDAEDDDGSEIEGTDDISSLSLDLD